MEARGRTGEYCSPGGWGGGGRFYGGVLLLFLVAKGAGGRSALNIFVT